MSSHKVVMKINDTTIKGREFKFLQLIQRNVWRPGSEKNLFVEISAYSVKKTGF